MSDTPQSSRHQRQTLLPQIGREGQRRLRDAHAMIVGCGALGCVVADALCRAGVGALTIIDRDFVELSNLQRQILFDEKDAAAGLPKAEAARRRLAEIDPAVRVHGAVDDFSHRSAETLLLRSPGARGLPPIGAIVDGTDNFETRYLLNDLAVKHAVPYIYAGVVGVEGAQMTVLPRSEGDSPWVGAETPCLRCLFPQAPAPGIAPTCDTAGVLGPAVAAIAAIETTEALKVLLGCFGDVRRSLMTVNVWTGAVRSMATDGARSIDCPCCAHRRFAHLSGEGATVTTTLCGRGAVQILPPAARDGASIDLGLLARRLAAHGRFEATPFVVRGALAHEQGDSGGEIELAIFANGRAIIGGAGSPERARSIYARYVGA